MESASETAEFLSKQILDTETKLAELKAQLSEAEARIEFSNRADKEDQAATASSHRNGENESTGQEKEWPLSSDEYKRYGRQLITPSIGIQGQLRLKCASVLLVGSGGLGCPAAAYLAGAGVGKIGLVDGDTVEVSNLHRQILHSTFRVGVPKVDSAITYLRSLNPNPTYVAYPTHLTPQNAAEIVSAYDVVLDCTDHPTSRYLISDICVLLQKPLVSASALRTDGQLMILNYPPRSPGDASGGPCYRCIFPKPPPVESVVSCGDGGILGPVVGVMGVLQALECIKLIAAGLLRNDEAQGASTIPAPSLLLFSAMNSPPFRTVKLRPRRADCFACSKESSLSLDGLTSGSLDYVAFCGVESPVTILSQDERVDAKTYAKLRTPDQDTNGQKEHLLVDVREKVQFDICHLDGSTNAPFSTSRRSLGQGEDPAWLPRDLPEDAPIYVICRLGNDSQVITRQLKEKYGEKRPIVDIRGGFRAWKRDVDNDWPEY